MSHTPRQNFVQCLSPTGLHKMAYLEWGDPANGNVLVCAHGLTRAARDFQLVAEALCDRYRVVSVDVVGRGASDWLKNPANYLVPNYVADMVTLIARLNPDHLHWFGTSMGGLIGMGLASLPDSPIERLILNDVGPILTKESIQRIASYVGQPVSFASFDEAEKYVRMLSVTFGPHSEAQWKFFAEVVLRQREDGHWILHYDPKIAVPFQQQFERDPAGADINVWPVYEAIRCPTLAVRGELSDLLTRQTHEDMAQRGPKAELVTIAGVGHAPTFLHEDQIAIARKFLLAGLAS